MNLALLGHGNDIVGITSMGKGGISKGKNSPAMTYIEAVQMIISKRHFNNTMVLGGRYKPHPQRLGQAAIADHFFGNAQGKFISRGGCCCFHCLDPIRSCLAYLTLAEKPARVLR